MSNFNAPEWKWEINYINSVDIVDVVNENRNLIAAKVNHSYASLIVNAPECFKLLKMMTKEAYSCTRSEFEWTSSYENRLEPILKAQKFIEEVEKEIE